MPIEHIIKGDLFQSFKKFGNSEAIKNIIHVVNDKNVMGAGFVIPLAKHFPRAKSSYHKWMSSEPIPKLGDVDKVDVGDNICIWNMLAQHNTISEINTKPLRYVALTKCLITINRSFVADKRNFNIINEIHCPMFGAGLAGGKWELIREIIDEIFSDTPIYVYTIDP